MVTWKLILKWFLRKIQIRKKDVNGAHHVGEHRAARCPGGSVRRHLRKRWHWCSLPPFPDEIGTHLSCNFQASARSSLAYRADLLISLQWRPARKPLPVAPEVYRWRSKPELPGWVLAFFRSHPEFRGPGNVALPKPQQHVHFCLAVALESPWSAPVVILLLLQCIAQWNFPNECTLPT